MPPKDIACFAQVRNKVVLGYQFQYDPTDVQHQFSVDYNDINNQASLAPIGMLKNVKEHGFDLTLTIDVRERLLMEDPFAEDIGPGGAWKDILALKSLGINMDQKFDKNPFVAPGKVFLILGASLVWQVSLRKANTKFTVWSSPASPLGRVPLRVEVSASVAIESAGLAKDYDIFKAMYENVKAGDRFKSIEDVTATYMGVYGS